MNTVHHTQHQQVVEHQHVGPAVGGGHGHYGAQVRTGKEPDCEWMWGDAATGLLGFNALADLNPMRGSGSLTIDKCIDQLRKEAQTQNRPVIVKWPSGVMSHENKFATIQEAIDY